MKFKDLTFRNQISKSIKLIKKVKGKPNPQYAKTKATTQKKNFPTLSLNSNGPDPGDTLNFTVVGIQCHAGRQSGRTHRP